MSAEHTPTQSPHIIETIFTSRVIRLVADPNDARALFEQYGRMVTGHTTSGPHLLVVTPSLEFDTVVQEVREQLQMLCNFYA